MWVILLGFVLVVLLYLKLTKNNKYWEEKGVPHPKPWIIVGNLGSNIFRRKTLMETFEDVYNSYPEEKMRAFLGEQFVRSWDLQLSPWHAVTGDSKIFVKSHYVRSIYLVMNVLRGLISIRYIGYYQFLQPQLMLRDPDLIKQITVKDFDTFPDHSMIVTPEVDPIFSKNLFAMTVKDGWHDMRSTLSPAFTSSKMKIMYTLMQQCSEQFINYFKDQVNGIAIVELKDVFTRFANDVIGTTAFGVSCDSLKDKNNQFYLMGKDATNFSGFRSLKFLLALFSPRLMKLLGIRLFSRDVITFFSGIIIETIRNRDEKQIVRPDMIHLLMEAQRGRLKHNNDEVIDTGFAVVEESEIGKVQKKLKAEITQDDIIAQALVFFIGGFDTVSTLMCYIAYELAVNPHLQKKLQEEIDDAVEKCKGTVTYEALLEMRYLDNVVTETLRMHPPLGFTDRKSIRPYTINSERHKEKSLHLEKGTIIAIPIHAIHMDSKNYPDPNKFDPDRFNDENKHNIKPYTYIPFGVGPRNCLASRFALLETKLIVVELLRNFEFVPVEKTEIPPKLSKINPNPLPDGGFWLGFKSR